MIKVLPLWSKVDRSKFTVVSTVNKNNPDLSPFSLGPCNLYDGYISRNMENAWQFSKVYPEHFKDNKPTQEYWNWAKTGWLDHNAHRYPMGKGRKPLFSLWQGMELGYIDARKAIYAPLYAEQVVKTKEYARLKKLVDEGKDLVLLDYDAYDHQKMGMTLTDVLNNPDKKMGHAFVLSMLLTNDEALKQIELRQ